MVTPAPTFQPIYSPSPDRDPLVAQGPARGKIYSLRPQLPAPPKVRIPAGSCQTAIHLQAIQARKRRGSAAPLEMPLPKPLPAAEAHLNPPRDPEPLPASPEVTPAIPEAPVPPVVAPAPSRPQGWLARILRRLFG